MAITPDFYSVSCGFDPHGRYMKTYGNLIFVDVEATGVSPFSGVMTEFGAVKLNGSSFHGVLWDSEPSKENPAKPVLTGNKIYDRKAVMINFDQWLKENVKGKPVFVSDNPAYDFMWVNYSFDEHMGYNPFGHSGRRISDFYAGLQSDWSNTQKWKRFRKTVHDHNPVNDARGNAEEFQHIIDNFVY